MLTSSGIGLRPVAAIDDVALPGAPDLLEAMRAGCLAVTDEPLQVLAGGRIAYDAPLRRGT
jgi:hypothetical protein